QAEDGIRDPLVTGVQTCALPILVPTRNSVPDHTNSAKQPMTMLARLPTMIPYAETELLCNSVNRVLPTPNARAATTSTATAWPVAFLFCFSSRISSRSSLDTLLMRDHIRAS